MEIWKDIIGYEGRYQISNYGNCRNIFKKQISLLLPRKRGKGYYCYGLVKDNKRISYSVHRLVAIAFIQNSNNKPQVNHKDCNKFNNHFSNLEWCNNSENQKHAFNNGLNFISENQKELVRERFSKKVIDINTNIIYNSFTEASKKLGKSYAHIVWMINNKKDSYLKLL